MGWQTSNFLLFLAVTGYGIYLFYKAVYHRYLYLKLGGSADFRQRGEGRWAEFLSQVFTQKKLMKDPKSGLMHIIIFYGFIILQFGALDLIVKGLTGGKHLPIPGYEVFGLMQEVTVVLILVAMGYAAYRRYGEKLTRLKKGWKPSLVILFIFFLMVSVVLTLSFERVWMELSFTGYSPISSFIALALTGISSSTAYGWFMVFWWMHLLILLAFLVYVPQSKHFHIITAPINIWFRRSAPVGRLTKLDLEDEEAESFGVGKIEDFSQKQMLDFYACVECGRCTDVCPASSTGKVLSPMHLITKLRDHMVEKGTAITGKSPWVPHYLFASSGTHALVTEKSDVAWNANESGITNIVPTLDWHKSTWGEQDKKSVELELIGDVITEEEIWSCTTCRNCEDQCPVSNEHVDKIIDLRRHLVLMQGSVPHEGQRAMQNIERQGNPWGLNRNDRATWTGDISGIKVPTVKENPDFEYLFFVGSMGSYDLRSRSISRALARY